MVQLNRYGRPVKLGILTEEAYRAKSPYESFSREEVILRMANSLATYKYYNTLEEDLWMYTEDYVKQEGWEVPGNG